MKYDVDFIKYFTRNNGHGNGLVIKGGVGTAKTTMLSFLTKLLADNTDFIIVSNIRFHDDVFSNYINIKFVSKLSQYLKIYSETSESQPLLLIWDDSQGNTEMTSKGVRTKGGEILASFLIYLRKLSSSYIYIAHQSYMPRAITEGFEPYYIYKINKSDFLISDKFYEVDSEAFLDIENIRCNLPDYRNDKYYLPILSQAFTDFEFDIDWFDLKRYLTAYEVGENLREYVKKYLDSLNNTNENNEFLKLKNLTYQDIYIALCLKRNKIISDSAKLNSIINPNSIATAKKLIKENRLL